MPFQRFRSHEEARQALWTRDDPELADRLRRLWSFSRRLAPGCAPRGLRKFRSIEEANRERQDWTARRARALRDARLRS